MAVREIVRQHLGLLVGGIVLGLLGSAASLAQPVLIGELIKAVSEHTSLVWPLVSIAALFCADAGLSASHAYLIGRAGENIVFGMRGVLMSRILRSDMAHFSRLEHGDVFTRVVTDTSVARIALTQSVAQIATSVFTVAGGLALMAWLDWPLLLLTVGCLGSASAVSLLLARQVRRAAVGNRTDTSAFGSRVQRVMGAMSTVKASRAEQREAEDVSAAADAARRSGIRVSALSAMLTPAINVGTQISLAAVVGWGVARVATGALPIADLTAFVMYLFYLVAPLALLFLSIGQFQQGRAAMDRVDELAAIEQEEPQAPQPAVTRSGPALTFENVTFGYGDAKGEPALDNVSFEVPERGLTAIVGPSGAGKTSAFQLIERFYRPQQGTVRLGGADIGAMPLDQIRSLVGYVEQHNALLRGTVRDNLTYAHPTADTAAVARAVEFAALADVVIALPDGLDTRLGEQGAGLSGGQQQRLAIARTLLQEPRVVLLDEATAHLDSDAEARLLDTITAIAEDCAVVAIAHRISTVMAADHIVVLDGGRVRASGTHAQLMATDTLYRRLASQQLSPAPLQAAP
ncbi:ABC transporter ATP-binding protein [Streptomyces sp. NPDC015032]|uniref:ABC transporter ATP-binding protein n=1 Tax=Streptomyces sp. NPDC015032 TaxID=3364937 RepID=UPI0036FF41F9